MITRMPAFVPAAVLLLLFAACGAGLDREGPAFPSDYRSWEKPVEGVLDYPVPGHGPGARIIYANSLCFDPMIRTESGRIEAVEMKDGAMVVKEVYKSKEEALKKGGADSYSLIFIMYKDRGHPDAQAGWLYYIYRPGGPMTAVKGRMCVECHVAANEPHPYFDRNSAGIFRDYLFSPFAKSRMKTAVSTDAGKKKLR